jgi:uncharacterized protein DUF3349
VDHQGHDHPPLRFRSVPRRQEGLRIHMTETTNPSVLNDVLGWLHKGYPEGVPQKDYFPLLALLKRSLTEEQVVKAAQVILKANDSDTVSEEEIHEAVAKVIEKEPNPEEIHQVAARLASVGWPLQVCSH